MGPPAFFKIILCCKRVKSTDVSHKQKTPKKSVETTSIRVAKSVVVTEVTTNVVKSTLIFMCIPDTKRNSGSCLSVFNIVIFDFDKI